jgi:hypothetical protein
MASGPIKLSIEGQEFATAQRIGWRPAQDAEARMREALCRLIASGILSGRYCVVCMNDDIRESDRYCSACGAPVEKGKSW